MTAVTHESVSGLCTSWEFAQYRHTVRKQMWASHCPAPPQTMLWIWQLCTDKIQMLLSVALSFAKNSFEWPKKYKILLTEYFLFQKPCKCHLIDPQVSKGHTTGVLRTLPMVEPRPAFSHTVSSVCKPVWYMLHSTIQCTVIATCIMCTLYTRVGA